MASTSILIPVIPRRVEQILPYAALVDWTPAARLWQGHSQLIDTGQMLAAAAGAGFRVPTGIGVELMPLRHPFAAAQQARSLAMATGESVVAGFGPASQAFQAMLHGTPYRSQLGAVREYVTIVRGLLAGETVDHAGEYFTCRGALIPAVAPPVEIGLGVLRPRMARLAGEVADVVITWMTPASYLRDVIVPAVTAGAREAGRPVPRVVAMVPVALHDPAIDITRTVLQANSGHLSQPHYVDMLTRAGLQLVGREPAAIAEAVVAGRAFLHGSADEVAAMLAEYDQAGVDEVVLNLTGVHLAAGPRVTRTQLQTLLGVTDTVRTG